MAVFASGAYVHNVKDITDILTANDVSKATASGEYGGGEAIWMAFSHNGGADKWSNTGGNSTGWLQWDCGVGNAKSIDSYTVTGRGDGYPDAVMHDWILSGSDDGETWTQLDAQSVNWSSYASGTMLTFMLATPSAPFRFFRIAGHSNQYACAIGELELLECIVPMADPRCYLPPSRRDRLNRNGVSTKNYLAN